MLAVRNPVRGFLSSVGVSPEILVRFQYNPTQLSDKRSVTYAALNGPGLLMPARQYTQGGDRTISFTVRVDGLVQGPADLQSPISIDEQKGITPELNKYRAFVYPQTDRWRMARASFVPLYELQGDRMFFAAPPVARFGFGDRVINCMVTDVTITELLFNEALAPLRADIAVTLVELLPHDTVPQGRRSV